MEWWSGKCLEGFSLDLTPKCADLMLRPVLPQLIFWLIDFFEARIIMMLLPFSGTFLLSESVLLL